MRAYGGPQFQVTQQVMNRFAEAIERAGVDVVPKIVMGGKGDGSGGTSVLETLLALLLSDRMGEPVSSGTGPRPEVEALRNQIRQSLMGATETSVMNQLPVLEPPVAANGQGGPTAGA